MLSIINNLHEKRITENQDGRNFGNAYYLIFSLVYIFLLVLQLRTRVTQEIHSFSANLKYAAFCEAGCV